MVAYACDPSRGGEPGVAWNWAQALAERGHTIELLTRLTAGSRDQVHARLQALGEPGRRVHIHNVARDAPGGATLGIASTARQMARELRGYSRWQRQALIYARAHDLLSADIVHHVSYGSLIGGAALHELGPPTIFGPVGGGQTAPWAFRRYLGRGGWAETVRSLLWVKLSAWRPSTHRSLRAAAMVLATNRDTVALARRCGARNVRLMLADGTLDGFLRTDLPERRASSPTVLWVGQLVPRKAAVLALLATAELRRTTHPTARLVIVGEGPQRPALERTRRALGLDDAVAFVGSVPHDTMRGVYDAADVLLFTSLRDSFGVQNLEAWARGLPSVCLDHQGIGDFAPPGVTRKVSLGDPAALPMDLARALSLSLSDPQRQAHQAAAIQHASTLTWKRKAAEIERAYMAVLEPEPMHSRSAMRSPS